MFLKEVISQERRSSVAITAANLRRKSEISPEMLMRRKSEFPMAAMLEESSQRKGSGGSGTGRRRSSLFRPPAPAEPKFTWKMSPDQEQWAIVQGDGSETTLVHRKNEASSMKNFGVEIRGFRDVDVLLENAVIILRPKNVVLKDLLEEIICSVSKSVSEDKAFQEEVQNELFTDAQAQIFTNTLQGFVRKANAGLADYDSSWLCAFCNLTHIKKRAIAIVRMKQPTNFGETSQEVRFFILVLCPSKSKETKTALETSRTFATLFSDPNLRNSLLLQPTEESFKNALLEWAAKSSRIPDKENEGGDQPEDAESQKKDQKTSSKLCCGGIGSGIKDDLKRRLPHYLSDYTDGVADGRSIQKTVSTTVFLYFACLLPTIAFATLNSDTTQGRMDVRKGIFAQFFGQLVFAIIGGQHLSILLTTAPLSLFVKIIFSLSQFFGIVNQFEAFYCCVGLWTSLFLFLSAILNMSKVMKYCTRSTEEIFALFISIAFLVYAITDTTNEFQRNYDSDACIDQKNVSYIFQLNESHHLNNSEYNTLLPAADNVCHRDSSLLYLLLMLGTFWFGFTLYNFKNTPFLQRSKREILSDYSLPLAVVTFSFIGSFFFHAVPAQRFQYNATKPILHLAPVHTLNWATIVLSAGLGFCLAVLIFMDQNIGSAIVNNPSNKLTKGAAYNWDLVVISMINVFCSLFGLPWLHVALPHAPMHVKCLADIEERVEHGRVKQTVVCVRETRLTTILSHILMGFSLLLLPYPLKYILPSVFDGLYLYMGITALIGNQLFERILLIFTEQLSYPPNHYIRQVPQRKIHQFTLIQVLQLVLLCVLGFFPSPFVKVLFPLMLLFLLFSRQKILPKIIEKKYLDVLD